MLDGGVPSGRAVYRWRVPSRRTWTRPESSRTLRCWEMAGRGDVEVGRDLPGG